VHPGLIAAVQAIFGLVWTMKLLSKVVWSEGMYLSPQHFQAQGRYFEDCVHFAATSLWNAGYGYSSYRLDAEAIRNGTVVLHQAGGIFEDGLPFDMPESDPLPETRTIGALFPATADRLNLFLAIPSHVPDGANCTFNGDLPGANTRFTRSEDKFPDDNTGRDERTVALGRKNVRILLENEVSEHAVRLPLARVLRDASGFKYDEEFVPPSLRITAGERLPRMVSRLIEILEEKSAALMPTQSGRGRFQAGMSSGQVAQFWFLHSINSSLAPLRHQLFTKHSHPEETYREMLRLAGALCTFGLNVHPRTLPLYNHDNAGDCFEALDRHIREHLEMLAPSQAISIPLVMAERYFYNGAIKDERCLARSRWILGISSAIGEADIIRKTPQLVKVCSAKFVPELVRRALPGMSLTHLPIPPPATSARADYQYFSISKSGPCWEHLVQSKQVGVYVPGEIPPPELELTVILES